MALYFNGAEIPTSGDVQFGGISFNEVRFNGVTFWQSGVGIIAPDIPGFCDASDGQFENFIRVMWGYSNYKAIYNVWRRVQGSTDFEFINTVSDGDLWYDDLNVEQGIVYEYQITACWQFDDDTCSAPSEIDEGSLKPEEIIEPPLNAPLTLAASDGAYYDKIDITWSNGTEGNATAVNIYRNDILIDTVPFGVVSYTDLNVDPGSQYEYYVKFHNAGGEGPESNRDMGSTLDENIYVVKSGDTMTGDLNMMNGSTVMVDNEPVHTDSSHGSWSYDGSTLYITIP